MKIKRRYDLPFDFRSWDRVVRDLQTKRDNLPDVIELDDEARRIDNLIRLIREEWSDAK